MWFGWEGGEGSAGASSAVRSAPTLLHASTLAASRSSPSWKPKWPSTIHKRMLLARSLAPVIPVSLGFSSAPSPPGALPTAMRTGLHLQKASVPLPLPHGLGTSSPARTGGRFAFLPPASWSRWGEAAGAGPGQDGGGQPGRRCPAPPAPGTGWCPGRLGKGVAMGTRPPGPPGARPWGCSPQDRGFVLVPRCASQLLALSLRLNRELDVLKRINFLILL